MKKINISVLGDGGWGTTLSILLSKKGYGVCLWSAFPEYAKILEKKRSNPRFLPGTKLPKDIRITSDLPSATRDTDLIILAIPSQHMRSVLSRLKKKGYPKKAIYLSVAKGIEIGSLKRMSQVIREELGNVKTAVLSGPTIAHEVAKGIPAAAVIACPDKNTRNKLQDIFMTQQFRVYTCADTTGVELGGSLKNVIAIACGISDGLGFGSNTKSALLTRGLVEISRLGVAMGSEAKTFIGISGLGDLATTCFSPYSRNRTLGENIGKGKPLATLKKTLQTIAEGVPTAKSVHALSRKHRIDMPISKQVYLVLYKGKSPIKAVKELMTRKKKEE